MGGDFGALRDCYPWLNDVQLSSALDYYELYPDEIDARLEREERWTPESLWREHPFMRPDRDDNVGRGRRESH